MQVFVDLELTLIESWTDPKPLKENIVKIKEFCKDNYVSEITIFSLAIADKKDEKTFFERILPLFDSLLDLEVSVKTMEEIRDVICSNSRVHFKLSEWSDVFPFNGKSQPFVEAIRADKSLKNDTFVLFDDVVEDSSIILNDRRIIIDFIKI